MKNSDFKAPKKCPKCGKPLKIRHGDYGTYLDCTGYPKCKYTQDISGNITTTRASIPSVCPKCGKNLAIYKGKFGIFLGCNGYPKCNFSYNFEDPTNISCPKCGRIMRERKGKYGLFYGCSGYPDCKITFDLRIKEKKIQKPKEMVDLTSKILKSKETITIDKETIIQKGTIIYCPRCDNMLRSITVPRGKLIYYCKSCNIGYENITYDKNF